MTKNYNVERKEKLTIKMDPYSIRKHLADSRLCCYHYEFCEGRIRTKRSIYGATLRACGVAWKKLSTDLWKEEDDWNEK